MTELFHVCFQRAEGQPGQRRARGRCTTAAADHAGQEPWHLQGEKYEDKYLLHYERKAYHHKDQAHVDIYKPCTVFSSLNRCYAAANGTTIQDHPKFLA